MSLRSVVLWTLLMVVLMACNLSKNVPEGQYLLRSNTIDIEDAADGLVESEVASLLRQQPNSRSLFMPLRLKAHNYVDTVPRLIFRPFLWRTMEEKRADKNKRLRKTNARRLAKQERKNKKRIAKARAKGEELYIPKRVKLKDTINPRPFFREWLKYEFGEAPRIFDSISMQMSAEQIRLYLSRKGYFEGTVDADVAINQKKRWAHVTYSLCPNQPSMVDSMFLVTSNRVIGIKYEKFMEKGSSLPPLPFRFDVDKLAKFRDDLARFMRNDGIYGFRDSYVTFEIDTLGAPYTVKIATQIAQRSIEVDGVMTRKPFAVTRVQNVHFHIADTLLYKGNFRADFGLKSDTDLYRNNFLVTFDTLRYDWYRGVNEQYRTAYFLYNSKLPIRPELIEYQNLLEENNYYRAIQLDQSFNRLVQTGLFQSVKPEIIENKDNTIDVHYYLVPAKRQMFSFEPKATNSNGFLGVSSSVNYENKNLFGGGQKFRVSLLGGFESQGLLFAEDNENRNFNTLEFGPQIEYEIPGLFPMKLTRLSKRQNPKTIFSASYNLQVRNDFERQLFQLNYGWRFYDVMRTQVFSIGVPFIGGIQYVLIDPSEAFSARLEQLNDLFLSNAFSSQMIWKDIKMSYQFTNPTLKSGDITFMYAFNFDMAGMMLGLLNRNQPVNADGFKEILGVRYSQFMKLDNEFRLNHKLNEEKSINYRLQLGSGLPVGNNAPNMPFDYSFFGGGANDNRGFRAREMSPGVYKYYLDTNRTATEIGDIRIGGSVEYRFRITNLLKGAFFTDFGNIWTLNEDPTRPGGQFSADFWRQLSLSGGFGLRFDLDFLIFRLDIGLPLRHPALPQGAQWIFQSRQPYFDEAIEFFGPANYREKLPDQGPFSPAIHIGIGYPF